MRIKFFLILITFAMFGASNAFAKGGVQTKNKLPNLLGLDSASGTVYATVSSTQNQCNCKAVRFTPGRTNTEMALSILLAAKLSKKTVRVDLLEEGNCTSAYRVYLEGE